MTESVVALPEESIVVGVDGSANSTEALQWAAHQAHLTGGPLVAVTTWQYPAAYGYAIAWPENIDFAADAKKQLDDTIATVFGDETKIKVEKIVLEGHPAQVLENLSRTASLMVVGSRGHGAFTGMLIGSVSEHLATHGHCPVVIVRGKSVAE